MTLNLDKSKWSRAAFGAAIDSVTDRVNDPSAAGVDRYVGLEHLEPGVLTVRRWDTPDKVEAQKLRFEPGDVIFGRRRAYQKKVARADFAGICSAHALVLRAKPGQIDPDFLPVFLSSDYFLDRAIAISVGSLSPTVNWRDLRVQGFDFPPLDEQKRIADLLWAVEAYARSIQSVRRATSRAADELFEWFAASCEQTELATWITRIDAGRSPQAASSPPAAGEYGVLKVSAVGRDIFVSTESKRLLNQNDFRPNDAVRAGDVLVTRANAVVDNVARPCLVDSDHDNLMLSDKTLRLVPLDQYPSRLLLAALRARAYRSYVKEAVNGTEAKNISQKRILAGPVPALSARASDDLRSRLKVLDDASVRIDLEGRCIASLRSALMNTIFRGSE